MNRRKAVLRIQKAKYLGGHRLMISFSDGKEQIVDFGHFLENSKHPDIKRYLSTRNFKKFTVKNGDLMWGDFDLIFPIFDLYENKLERRPSLPTSGKKSTD